MTEAEAMHLLEKVVHEHEHEREYTSTVEALGRIKRALKDSHRDRWERTRDALIVKFSTYNCDNPLSFEAHFRQAEAYADRAHGKLVP